FNGSGSAGSPTAYAWKFGDGAEGSGAQAQHPYGAAGSYQVTLTITKPGDTCSFGICTASYTRTVPVSGEPPPPELQASFSSDATCFSLLCTVETDQKVAFTDISTGKVTKRTWDFGDGKTASGKTPTHTWSEPGSYVVKLTVENGESSASTSRTFVVEGEPEPPAPTVRNVVVPWIGQAEAGKALQQSSDLDVHNPGDDPLKVKVVFRKRGLPEPDPPAVELTIAPKATHHAPDIVSETFKRPSFSGFVFIEPLEGSAEPVVTATNRTFQGDGRQFGQVVPGVPIEASAEAKAAGSQAHHLVGLNANDERLAYFGISNPSDQPLFYHLRFYDAAGRLIAGTDGPQPIARFGQKQYQSEELARLYGLEDLDDYRIEIETVDGSPRPFIYGSNLRLASLDPSFLRPGRTDASEVFLVGVLNAPGLLGSLFQSDLVLGNPSAETALCDLTFTGSGFQTEPTAPVTETLPAGMTLRLSNVVSRWDLGDTVGVLRVSCDNPSGVFPVVQGESYDISRPGELYGQFMPALTVDDAATPGDPHALVGLEQLGETRTTVWLFNPSGDEVAEYSIRYFDLAGNELGGESGSRLGRGKLRQINPAHHPFGTAEGPGGFVVRVEVSSGKLLTAAQVVNSSNDPAYIVGE
ncbi:MAG TPA: PKD domain-containing protein, partial [Thermoanaerobaculia bacterium]|nr:PKD domain-containing protein [Thermoanaerobaculia bacterium]